MNVNEAWDAFIKSQSVKKASVDEKLDVLAAQMNEVQTTVDRLAETIPEAQGDMGAMDTANDSAMTEPNPEKALGAVAGAPEEEGVAAPGGAGGDAPVPPEDEGGELDEEDDGAPIDFTEEDLMSAAGGGDMGGEAVPPLTEEEMGTPPIGESNDVVAMVKEMIASEDDPGKLAQLSKILTAAVGTQTPQANQSYEEPDFSGAGSEMQMMKSAIVKEGEGTGVVGEKSTVDTGSDNTSGKSPMDAKPGADAAAAAVDSPNQDAPKTETSSVAASAKSEPSPELMEKIMDAVKGVLSEFFGEGSKEDIDESAEEAATDGKEVKIDDEDADVHVDVEEGGNVEVDSDGEEDEEVSDDEKIERNEEFSDGSSPFANSDCINKSFAEMLHSRIAQTVGIDGQFAKKWDPTEYHNKIEVEAEDPKLRRTGYPEQWMQDDAVRSKYLSPEDAQLRLQIGKEGEGEPVVGATGLPGNNSTEASNCAKMDDDEIIEWNGKRYRVLGYTTDDPDDPECGEVLEEVKDEPNGSIAASGCAQTESIAEMSQEEKAQWEKEVADGKKQMRETVEGMASVTPTQRTPAQEKFRSTNPELYDHVNESHPSKKSASDNGKTIMSLKDMMAIRKSADRMEVASTSNGSLTPPSLEGAAPIKMTSFRDMMGNGNDIRKSIEADADAYRLYKSQQNM